MGLVVEDKLVDVMAAKASILKTIQHSLKQIDLPDEVFLHALVVVPP